MNANAETHSLSCGASCAVFGHGFLNRDSALDGIDRTGEIGDDTVAGAPEDPPAMGRDKLVHNGATGGQPPQCADLVLPHQTTVACDIGREDRRELANGFFFLAHHPDEADSLAVFCANEALFFAAIANRAARRIDPRAQGRFGDDPPVPDGSEQIVLADDALAAADQVFEEIEDLGLQRDQPRSPPQLAPRRIQREILKGVEQNCYSTCTRYALNPNRVLTEPDIQGRGGQGYRVCGKGRHRRALTSSTVEVE